MTTFTATVFVPSVVTGVAAKLLRVRVAARRDNAVNYPTLKPIAIEGYHRVPLASPMVGGYGVDYGVYHPVIASVAVSIEFTEAEACKPHQRRQ